MQPYFTRFPTFTYSNTECVDITRRGTILSKGRSTPYVFYPYTIKNELRSDHIAEYYYNDSQLDWLIYISNGVLDPYYHWFLSPEKFNALMAQKYGSVENSLKKIKFYRNNWATDDNEIEPSVYENVILKSWKKYYSPVIAPNFKITTYRRKQQDTTMNTNRIIEYAITYNSGNSFTVGELVDIKLVGYDEASGGGEVVFSNASVVRIMSVSGNTTANSVFNRTIVGETSAVNANATAVVTIYENIPPEEEVFWSPVYMYEYEEEFNEQRKNLLLVGDGLSSLLVSDFTKLMQSDG